MYRANYIFEKLNVETLNKIINFKYDLNIEYDEICHLPEYDFSERVELLKKIHCDLSETLLCRPVCKRPTSQTTSRCSKRKTSAKKKKCSANRKNNRTPSLCNVSQIFVYLKGQRQLSFFYCLRFLFYIFRFFFFTFSGSTCSELLNENLYSHL